MTHDKTPFVLLILAAALALSLAPAQRADAQDEVKPLVLIVLDTSSSMEFELNDQNVQPACYPYERGSASWCDNGAANPNHTRSRFIVAQEVLTGRFSDSEYYCCTVERSAQEPDEQIPYHSVVPEKVSGYNGVTQIQDGIMDVYMEEVRFAYLTFDTNPAPGPGNAGGHSYNINSDAPSSWNSGTKHGRANRGNHGGYKTVDRASGALTPVPASDDPSVMAEQNAEMQQELRWTFPFGWLSPLAPAIDDARFYIKEDESIQNDACINQRPKAVIVVTDGTPHFDECYVEGVTNGEGDESPVSYEIDGDGDNDDCNAVMYEGKGPYNYPAYYYKTSELMAEKLYDETGFPTYVIGFNAGDAADAKLRAVAFAGRTCEDITADDCYYQAGDDTQLRFAFEDIIQRLMGEGTAPRARTRPATTTRTSFRDDRGGFYEVAASFSRGARRATPPPSEPPVVTPPTRDPDEGDATETCPGITRYASVATVRGDRIGTPGCESNQDCTDAGNGDTCYAGLCYTSDNQCANTNGCKTMYGDDWRCIAGRCYQEGSDCTESADCGRHWERDLEVCFMGTCQSGEATECPPEDDEVDPLDDPDDEFENNRTWIGRVENITFKCNDAGLMVEDSRVNLADTLAAMDPASRKIYTALDSTGPGDEMITLEDACEDIPDCDRALVEYMRGTDESPPLLADSYHASPVIAVGPELDLPLPGYKLFRRDHGDRDTMLYVATNGGIIHAFTLGDVDRSGDPENVERWAYIPKTIHNKLGTSDEAHILGVDGTPVVKDVRLYLDPERTPAEDWSTVLVGGFRGGGRGVYALDITDADEPRFLWEKNNLDDDYVGLGNTYAEPAIGAIALERDATDIYESAVVIIPGGSTPDLVAMPDAGKVLYVINLEDGRLLRRFTRTSDNQPLNFMTGSVAPSTSTPGALMTRAFMGDSEGRLLRLVFDGADPSDWELEVFFDPKVVLDDDANIEPVIVKPAIATDESNQLVIIYGSGTDASLEPDPENTNFVVSLTEKVTVSGGDVNIVADQNWFFQSNDAFKMTGAPLIFNNTAYLPLLWSNGDECLGRAARLYALHYKNTDENGGLLTTVDLTGDGTKDLYAEYDAGTVIFGLDVTIRPTCFPRGNYDNVYSALANAKPTKPQILLQTGRPAFPPGSGGTNPQAGLSDTPPAMDEAIDKVRIDVPRSPQGLKPISWGAVYK